MIIKTTETTYISNAKLVSGWGEGICLARCAREIVVSLSGNLQEGSTPGKAISIACSKVSPSYFGLSQSVFTRLQRPA